MVFDVREFEEGVREAVARFDEWFGQLDGRKKVTVSGFEPGMLRLGSGSFGHKRELTGFILLGTSRSAR